MREALFIFLIIFGLAAWTAFRYRKQISGVVGFARMLKEAKNGVARGGSRSESAVKEGVPLVNCSKCGVWFPQNKARKVGASFFCSDDCLA